VSATVRVIVVNADEEAAPELRAHLLSIDGLKIVAEVDEPAVLAQVLDQFPAEVLLIHLDPHPRAMMEALAPILENRSNCPAAIGMTEERDAELVVRAMRAGLREFLWKPFPPEQLSEILRRVGRESNETGRRMGTLVPVVATCGGVGATTLATNLAVELAQLDGWRNGQGAAGRPKVAVVDLDFRFGQVALFLDAQPSYTIAELCETPEQIDAQMIDRAMVKHPSGVHVLAHPPDFAQAERISAAQVAGALAMLQEYYDFVVVDGPVRFDPTARAVFDMTDVCLLVMQLLVPSVRSTDRLLQSLAAGGYSLDRVRLVCNRLGREAGLLEPGDAEGTLGRKLHWYLPDDWKTSSAAVNMGTPLFTYAPKSKLRAAYRQIAAELAGVHAPETEAAETGEDTSKRGLFSFLSKPRTN
jgi:pilus assembly protein CpaE